MRLGLLLTIAVTATSACSSGEAKVSQITEQPRSPVNTATGGGASSTTGSMAITETTTGTGTPSATPTTNGAEPTSSGGAANEGGTPPSAGGVTGEPPFDSGMTDTPMIVTDGSVPGTVEPSALADKLLGYWQTGGAIGDCIDVATYWHFVDGQALEDVLDDRDACRPPEDWVTHRTPGTYSLDGNTLDYTLADGASERVLVDVGVLGDSEVLFLPLYMPTDDRTWSAARSRGFEYRDADTPTRRSASVTLSFDDPLPTSGAGDCRLTLSFDVQQVYGTPPSETVEEVSDTLENLSCTFEPAVQGQQVTITDLDLSAQPRWVPTELHPVLAGGRFYLRPEGYLVQGWFIRQTDPPIRLQ